MTNMYLARRLAAATFVAALIVPPMNAVLRGADGERFTATATMTSAKATHSAPVTFQIDRFVSEADRDKFMAIVKRHKTTEIHDALAAMPAIGFIQTGDSKTAIKYAFARPSGGGRLITVATDKPIMHLG